MTAAFDSEDWYGPDDDQIEADIDAELANIDADLQPRFKRFKSVVSLLSVLGAVLFFVLLSCWGCIS